MIGLAVMIVAMIVFRSTFGLRNIRGPVCAAAFVGALIGFCFPRLFTARFLEPWLDGLNPL